jgi:regulator of sigma E protease
MALTFLYAILAIFGLGLLVFIHEWGHFWAARRQKMKVEVFSIGFGKPLYSWMREGVRWQIGWLPFGGYVKIAGMQREGSLEPSEIEGGFYSKRPWQRIQVALAGPLVNIAFAFAAFFFLWCLGGKEVSFLELTHRIGWVDPQSVLYQKGVRPGDIIDTYNGHPYHGVRDLQIASLMKGKETEISGEKIDYLDGKRSSFSYELPTYQDTRDTQHKRSTVGVVVPATYLFYSGRQLPGSPMEESGIEPGDRLLWADGELLFSPAQLSALINESNVFLTVQRGDAVFQTKVPRVPLSDLEMTRSEKGEVDDWQHEAGIRGRLQDLAYIPYTLSPDCKVESRLAFIDETDQLRAFGKCQRCSYFSPLQEGDTILAIDGALVKTPYQLLTELQTRHVLLIVQRDPALLKAVKFKEAEAQFEKFDPSSLEAIVSSIGTDAPIEAVGSLRVLRPVTPKAHVDLATQEWEAAKKQVEGIQDSQLKSMALKELETKQRLAVLGISLKDRQVVDNLNPLAQFLQAFQDTWKTLSALVTGTLSPKFVSGPVGIIQVVQHSWTLGAKSALYWMGVISLNLGFMNLLPIPVLDGGHIVFSLWEWVTKKAIKAKTMERMLIPFVGLLIAFFIFVTYQDIARLLSKVF